MIKRNYGKWVFAVLLIAGVVGFAGNHAMAADGTGSASASVVIPISIEPGDDLLFGEILSNGAGTVIVQTDGGVGGSIIPISGSTQPGTFNVLGDPDRAYNISHDSTFQVDTTPTSTPMDVNDIIVNALSNGPPTGVDQLTGILNQGANPIPDQDFLTVGATLNVNQGQPSGIYNGTYNVSVDY